LTGAFHFMGCSVTQQAADYNITCLLIYSSKKWKHYLSADH